MLKKGYSNHDVGNIQPEKYKTTESIETEDKEIALREQLKAHFLATESPLKVMKSNIYLKYYVFLSR